MSSNLDVFMAEYEKNLKVAMEKHPDEYRFGVERVPEITKMMREAVINSTFNKESHGFKWTCQSLNIRHTYMAIKEFIAGSPAEDDGKKLVPVVFEVEILLHKNTDPEKCIPTIKSRLKHWLNNYSQEQAAKLQVRVKK